MDCLQNGAAIVAVFGLTAVRCTTPVRLHTQSLASQAGAPP